MDTFETQARRQKNTANAMARTFETRKDRMPVGRKLADLACEALLLRLFITSLSSFQVVLR